MKDGDTIFEPDGSTVVRRRTAETQGVRRRLVEGPDSWVAGYLAKLASAPNTVDRWIEGLTS